MTNSVALKLLSEGLSNPSAYELAKSTFVTARSAIPVILAPSGTVATAGVVTLGTALPLTYTAAWVRLPADAVVGGLAGLYFVVFSSTTVGQVYTNFVDTANAFTPYVPATLVAAVGSNAAYTQVTTDIALVNVTVPAASMGADGSLITTVLASNNGTAGIKTISAKLGTSVFMSAAITTSVSLETQKRVTNRGRVDSQLVTASGDFGIVSAVAPTQLGVNTAGATSVSIIGNIAVATDYLVLESFIVELQPS